MGLDGSASRIMAFTSLTEVVAATLGKCRGLLTPLDGDTTTSVKVNGFWFWFSPSSADAAAGGSGG